MFTKLAAASVVALGTSEVRGNWLDELLPAVGDVLDQTGNMVVDAVVGSHETDDGLMGTIEAQLKKGILEAMTKKEGAVKDSDKGLKRDPDFSKTFAEIVSENGFISEVHPVTTTDGYELNVFRIRSPTTKPGAPVVFMQHGITDSADCFIMNYADVAPAFQYVRAGYDVWLGNNRGTKYSLGHKALSTRDHAYWQFSWTELGKYDLPAMIGYTTEYTGVEKVTYMAHSQGTTQMFYALTASQDYWKSKVNLFVALAPITRLDHTTNGLLSFFAGAVSLVGNTLTFFHVYDLFGSGASVLTKAVCGIIPQFC